MFVIRGDRMMPSIALTAAKLASKHNVGSFDNNLFANVVVDPAKKESKNIVVYFDSDDPSGRAGGNVRVLNGAPTWYVDKLLVTSSGADTAIAVGQLRKHVNFLCSLRRHPAFCDEDQTWYRILHVAMIGRPSRPGRSGAGQDLYEASLRVMWRPMSANDPDYVMVTGIGPTA